MPVTPTAVFPQAPKIGLALFGNSDGTTAKTLYTAGPNGSKIVAMWALSFDTSTRRFLLNILRSAITYNVSESTIPISAGGDGITPTHDLLRGGAPLLFQGLPTDNDGQPYLFLQSGDVLTGGLIVATTSTISVFVIGADF